ncbi:MAG: sigma-70 family RNA polymerase sigma factor [Patescibacteria group bacterium]
MEIHEYLKAFNTASLTRAERVELLTVLRNPTSSSKDRDAAFARIIGECVKTVLGIAMQYLRTGTPILDLVQEGVFALHEICLGSAYDPSLSSLMNYSFKAVEGAIRAYALNNMAGGKPFRLTNYMLSRTSRVRSACATLCTQHGQWPSAEQVRDEIHQAEDKLSKNMTLEQVDSALRVIREGEVSSLDAPVHNDQGASPLSNFIIKTGEDPECLMEVRDLASQAELLERTLRQMAEENGLDVEIFNLRSGLADCDLPLDEDTMLPSLAAIGRQYGISRERVRQRMRRVTRRLVESTGMDSNTICQTIAYLRQNGHLSQAA